MDTKLHERFMQLAIQEAKKAFEEGEVPIGAVITHNGEVVGKAHNQRELLKDPTAHAEILAITQAAHALGRWRLTGTRLYVTVEPCPMCAGAIVQARIDEVYYGATDEKAGAAGSLMNILADTRLNHCAVVRPGLLVDECRSLMNAFFRNLREKG